MKNVLKFIGVLSAAVVFVGCTSISKTAMTSVEVNEAALNTSSPSKEEADLIIITHIKKRSTEKPYTFVISVDGKEYMESVNGLKETESNVVEERGEGSNYKLVKRFRLKPETYEIALKSVDGHAYTKRKLAGGNIYTIVFNPVYGPRKFARPKDFQNGAIGFQTHFEVSNRL